MEKKVKTKDDFEVLAEKKINAGPGYFARISAKRDKETDKISLSVWRPLGNKDFNQNLTFGKKGFMYAIIDALKELEKKEAGKVRQNNRRSGRY